MEGSIKSSQPKAKRTRRVSNTLEDKRDLSSTSASRRSSIYRGVTRHRWTGRYEAHLWDKSCWNHSQNKKGKQVYLGAYDDEEAASRAYDMAALKYWGTNTLINFPLTDYTKELEEMQDLSREEYLASLRRKSSGFSRGVSKYRGVARHHHNGRWEARIGRIYGNKYLYLGTYSTQEEAAAAYDMAAIEHRGLNAVTNFDVNRYIRWDIQPGQNNIIPAPIASFSTLQESSTSTIPEEIPQTSSTWSPSQPRDDEFRQSATDSTGEITKSSSPKSSSMTALSLLEQSSLYKSMVEQASSTAGTELDLRFDAVDDDDKVEASILDAAPDVAHQTREISIFPGTNLQSEYPFLLSISPCGMAEEIEHGGSFLDPMVSGPFQSLSLSFPSPITTCS